MSNTLRKVLYKEWIPIEMIKNIEKGFSSPKKGTGCYEETFSNKGLFHQWVVTTDEHSDTRLQAIIELPDGTVELIPPHVLKFVNKNTVDKYKNEDGDIF